MTRQGAQNLLARQVADEMYVPISSPSRDDACEIAAAAVVVPNMMMLHACKSRVMTKARRVIIFKKAPRTPPQRAVVVPQDHIHHVGLAVEQLVETRAKNDPLCPTFDPVS